MEEVDTILILTLNDLGCDIDEGVRSVGALCLEEVVAGVVQCLRAINTDCELPTSLPHNMAQRFRAAAAIAQAVKDIGYPGDIGYQSLLYPNEADLRKIFMFLIERLPKDTAAVSDEPLNRASIIHREARRKLAEGVSQPWVPPAARHLLRQCCPEAPTTLYGTHHLRTFTSRPYSPLPHPTRVPQGLQNYYQHCVRRVTELVGPGQLIATLLNTHAQQLHQDGLHPAPTNHQGVSEAPPVLEPLYGEGQPQLPGAPCSTHTALSPFLTATHMMDLTAPVTEKEVKKEPGQPEPEAAITTEEQLHIKREQQVSQLEQEISSITNNMSESRQAAEQSRLTLASLTAELEEEEGHIEEQRTELRMKQRTSSLLPESDTNIQRLQTALRNSEEKMVRLQQQWQAHKQPLEEQLNHLTLQLSNRKVNKEEILSDMADLRDRMKGMVQEAAHKEAALTQLKGQLEKMNRDINRSVYTKQIVDISAKVRKQKQEINRVLADTRTIQKEINTLSGKLERTFTVVEGTAYKEATNKERARQVYRAVAAVHEGCGELVELVRETGAIQRETSDLREQVDLEKSKKVEETLEQLRVDLIQVKKENASLKQQLMDK